MTVTREFLESVPYFAGLSAGEIDKVAALTFEKSIGKGEIITFEGDRPDTLFCVVSGAVKSFKTSEEGKEQIIQIVLPGDTFNDLPVFDGGISPVSCEAMSAVGLCGILRVDFLALVEEIPGISANVPDVLSTKLRHLLELVEDLSFRNVIRRIGRILLQYASEDSGPRPRLTQQEMASMAGTAREVVGRSLKTLSDEGLIRMERNRLIISNREALQSMVGETKVT